MNIKQHICLHEYKGWKVSKKRFSILDIKSLLYLMNLLQEEENCNNEQLFGNEMQNILLQFGIIFFDWDSIRIN